METAEAIKPNIMDNPEENSEQLNTNSEICKFYLSGRCRFATQCRNIHPACASPPPSPRKKSEGKEVEQNTHLTSEKKPPMKTADCVVNRIIWDEKLPVEKFVIGYLDRFLGILEKPFHAFSWEHLAEVDINVLAIPKHRIQYFKYRGIKVWDKNERVDNVFGSTGTHKTIIDVMREIDDLRKHEKDENAEEIENEIEIENEVEIKSEEEIEKLTNFISAVAIGKRALLNKDCKPTHFICVKITNRDVIEKCLSIQKLLIRHEPCYADYVIPADDFHITIALLNLDNLGAIFDSVELLKDVSKELNNLSSMKLNIVGLDLFYRTVLFAKVNTEDDVFFNFIDGLVTSLIKVGVCVIVDREEFIPHLTLLKTSSLCAKRYVEPMLVHRVCGDVFGVQLVDNLALCSMGKNKDGVNECIAKTEITGIA